MSQRGTVQGIDQNGNLVVIYHATNRGGDALPAPGMGSSTTGFHSAPPLGAEVLTLFENPAFPRAAAHITASGGPVAPVALLPGESILYGPDGSILLHTVLSGPVTLYRNKLGTVSLTIDPVSGALALTHPGGSGGVVDNGTVLSVP